MEVESTTGRCEVSSEAENAAVGNCDENPPRQKLTNPARAQPASSFNRYGDRYFLSEIWTGSDLGRQLPKSRAEKEQIAAVPARQGIVTLAAER